MIVKALKTIGSLIYGAVMYYILWLLFYWITPYIMSVSWMGFLIYLFVAGGAISMFVGSVANIIGIPLIFLCKNCNASKYAPILFGLIFGYSSIRLPWTLDMEYGILQIILAILTSITILISFVSLMYVPFKIYDE